MDAGNLIGAAMVAAGLVGFGEIAWRSRRRPPSPVLPARSHVRRVAPIVRGVGPTREGGSGFSPASIGSTDVPRSLALEAYSTIAGGTELEARIETARRRLAQHSTFGDAAVRRRDPDRLVQEVAAYLAHASQQQSAR